MSVISRAAVAVPLIFIVVAKSMTFDGNESYCKYTEYAGSKQIDNLERLSKLALGWVCGWLFSMISVENVLLVSIR